MKMPSWSSAKDVFSTLKDFFNICRDMLFVVVLALFFVFPAQLNSLLVKAGVTSVNTPLFTWKNQVAASNADGKAAAQANAATSTTLQQVNAVLKSAAATTRDPKLKQILQQSTAQIDDSLASVASADQSIKKSIVTQEGILQEATGGTPQKQVTGWLYLGEIDESKHVWTAGSPKGIAAGSPLPSEGQVLRLTDDLYVRADPVGQQRYNEAAILSAVRSGTSVTVDKVAYSHALNGGNFVWVHAKLP